jgi:MFS family permease
MFTPIFQTSILDIPPLPVLWCARTESRKGERVARMSMVVEKALPWHHDVSPKAWRAFIAAYLGWALDAMDSMLYSLVIIAVMKEYNLNPAQAGLLASITFFSAGVGSWFYGMLADRIGRKRTLMVSIQLAIFRVIVGFGVGGEWGAGAALVSETWPTRFRSKVLGVVQSGFAVGYLLGAVIAALIMPHYGWRWVFFVGVLPAFLALWIMSGIEETDKFVEMRKRGRERGQDDGFFCKFAELWTKPYARSTLGIMIYGGLSLFAWYAIFSWLPGYLGTPVEKGGAGLSIVKSNVWVIVIQVGAVFGYIFFGFFADAVGRRKSTVSFLLLFAVMVPIFVSIREPNGLLIAGPLLAFFGYGYIAGFGTISAELYPTRIRATAQGFIYGCGRFTSALAPYAVGLIALKHGLGAGFLVAPAALLIAALGVVVFIRETKGEELAV